MNDLLNSSTESAQYNAITRFFYPYTTYFLIAFNVAVFLFTLPMNQSQEPMLACFQRNHPECIRLRDEKSSSECMFDQLSKTEGTLPSDVIDRCLYVIDDECMTRDNIVFKECLQRESPVAAVAGVHSDALLHPKEWHTFITSEFVHANFAHLFSNMLMLLLVGPYIESRLRRRYFLTLYIGAGIVGAAMFALFNPGYATLLVGASGAISGLLGASLFLDVSTRVIPEDQRVLIWGRKPFRLSAAYLVFFAFQQVFLGVFEGGPVAYMGHLGSFLGGLLFMAFFFAIRDKKQVLRSSDIF